MTANGGVTPRLEAKIELRISGPVGSVMVDAVIDTGFTAFLTIPTTLIKSLALVKTYRGSAFLADGLEHEFDVYAAEIDWNGSMKPVFVYELGTEVLVGMSLLLDHELRVEIRPGGTVELKPLP